jgi:hypothetical protein
MEPSTDVLDDAFDRLGMWGFDEPGGYVNHGPMACEALDVLGRPTEVDAWSRLDEGTPPVRPVEPTRFVWSEALGDPTRAGEWMGYFERAVADDGWAAVVHEWLPRLLPGLNVALFHGAIRCAHAARAIDTADTPARRAELVRALGYWAALFEPGYPPDTVPGRHDDVELALAQVAADSAQHYIARPNIIQLHGITSAMAVSTLVRFTDEEAGVQALGQIRADLRALHDGVVPATGTLEPDIDRSVLIEAAVASGDAHAVKLVEASSRGFELTGAPAFLAAAERVTRRGRRALMTDDPLADGGT